MSMMRLYVKKNADLDSNVVSADGCKKLVGQCVCDFDHFPYIDMVSDSDVFENNEILRKLFLKASIIAFPNYTKKSYKNSRQFGIYRHGKARAELTPAQNAPYWLKIETSHWEGIADMKVLQERLWAGTITPTTSYERKQKRTLKERLRFSFFMFCIFVTVFAGAVTILGFINMVLESYDKTGLIMSAIDARAAIISLFILTFSVPGVIFSYIALPSYRK